MLEPGNGSQAIFPKADGRNVTASSPTTRRRALGGFAALNALAVWVGAFGLVTGGTDFGERANDRLPFNSLLLAGLALAVILAIPLTLLAWSAWTGAPRTTDIALIVGLMLIA